MFFSTITPVKGLFTCLLLASLSVFTCAAESDAHQVEGAQAMPHRLYFSAGGYVINQSDMVVSLSDSDAGAGVSISPRDTLGLDIEQAVARLDGRYRFTEKHSLSFSLYRITSDGYKVTKKDFEWTDEDGDTTVIKAGAELNSSYSNTIMKLAYDWSFYHSEKIELYTSAGLNIAQFKLDLDIQSSVNGEDDLSAENINSSLPLPTFGLGLNYRVNDAFYWYLKSQAFAIAFEDVSAYYSNSQFGFEYQPFNYFGVGLSYSVDRQTVTEKNSKTKLSYNNGLRGINLYLSTYF